MLRSRDDRTSIRAVAGAASNGPETRPAGEMEVTIKVPDKLAAEARARGVSVEVYVQEILAK
jgi:hypothetical protein